MKWNKSLWLRYAGHAVIILLIGYLLFGLTSHRQAKATATAAVGDSVVRISGPYPHENLTIYLIHSAAQDPRSFVTLNEALAAKPPLVEVSEKSEQGQVNELVIENKSDEYLFLQEGDTLRGGKQDRTIFASHVVPPHSGKQPLPAFCVEPRRWTAGEQGIKFAGTMNPALAPKEVREAAKYQGDQSAVWANVANAREYYAAGLALDTLKTSSYNDVGDSTRVRSISDAASNALAYVLNLPEAKDASGVAIAVNGQIEEINVYPNRQVLLKQFPRLIGSYAVQATVQRKDAKDAPAMSPCEVAQWMHQNEEDRRQVALANVRGRQMPAARGMQQEVLQSLEQQVGWRGQQVEQTTNSNDNVQRLATNPWGPLPNQARVQRVNGYVSTGRNAAPAQRVVNEANRFYVQQQESKVQCTTFYEGKAVHYQCMSRAQPASQPRNQPSAQQGQGGGQAGQVDQSRNPQEINRQPQQQPAPPQNVNP